MRRAFSRQLADAPAMTVLGVLWPLVESDDTALRLIGYELFANHAGVIWRSAILRPCEGFIASCSPGSSVPFRSP